MAGCEDYYRANAARSPRELLLQALDVCGPGQLRWAIDIGAGQGTETNALLERGWRVLAIDAEHAAAERLRFAVRRSAAARLTLVTADIRSAPLRPAALIWAGQALPFVGPLDFRAVWTRLRAALIPGGVLAADLWGRRHAWSAGNATHTRADVDNLLDGLDVIRLDEKEGERQTVADGPRHWHSYAVIARRPD